MCHSASKRMLWIALLAGITGIATAQSIGGGNACSRISLGIGASLNGFVPLPANSLWNKDVSTAPVDPNSNAIINFIGSNVGMHADFGACCYQGSEIGNPYIVVAGTQPVVSIDYTEYGEESDPGPMPIPANAPVQGDPAPPPGSDRHVMVIDKGNCWLYELWDAFRQSDGSWQAGSGAAWDLTANEQRPYTWTAADAAGTPMFPGMVRYDEIASGAIHHALEFTVQYSKAAFTPPASHFAATSSNSFAAPMGMRMRLKAGFDISGFPPEVQVVLTALKKYGMIVVDNGAPMFLSGTPDERWNNDHLASFRRVTASDFDVLKIDPLYLQSNYPRGPDPDINSFTATHSTGSGRPVVLSWNVSNGGYYGVSPDVGPLRGLSVTVYPRVTTTYTLTATNAYGRSTSTVMVNVPRGGMAHTLAH